MSTMNDGLSAKLGIVEGGAASATDDASSTLGAPGSGADGTGNPSGTMAVNPPPGDPGTPDVRAGNDGFGQQGGADDALTARDDEAVIGQSAADGLGGS